MGKNRIPIYPEQAFIISNCSLNVEGWISHKALNAQTEGEEMYLDRCSENNNLLMYFINQKRIKAEGCDGCNFLKKR